MKKNKNGFLMAETIVVIAVVAVILLGVYKLFSSVYYRYLETEDYNTENAINALANIQKYYESIGNIDTSELEDDIYINLTNDTKYESEFYSKLKDEFKIEYVYMMDLSKLNDTSGFDLLLRRYLDTLKNKTDIVLVICVNKSEFTYVEIENYNEIELVGDKDNEYVVYVNIKDEFTDPGYINWTGDAPTTSWEDDNEIDTSKEGTYYLHYNFNGQIIRRKIIVGDFIKEFEYIPSEQIYKAPYSGTYILEVWGAEGGSVNSNVNKGGYGGYSVGKVHLEKNEIVYVNVGGKGKDGDSMESASIIGGYNGGGSAFGNTDKYVSSGGGATHIAKISGELSSLSDKLESILIVAGGGGGAAYEGTAFNANGGSGGGINGVMSTSTNSNYVSSGATQTSSGTGFYPGTFGKGGCNATSNGCSGGGGGLYGGDAARYSGGGAGGSGYIGNTILTEKSMYCYNCTTSDNEHTKTFSTTNVSEDAISSYSKKGNGFARISLVS